LPPDQIVAAARANRDDDLDGMIGIAGLRLRDGCVTSESRECES